MSHLCLYPNPHTYPNSTDCNADANSTDTNAGAADGDADFADTNAKAGFPASL